MTRLWRWLMDRLERIGDLAQDAFAGDDEAANAVAWIKCPECGEELPITLSPVQLDVDDDGQQVAKADLQLDDVWAHAWTHDPDHD